MCYVLSNRFNLYNFGESVYGVHSPNDNDKKVKFLSKSDNYVIKLFPRHFYEKYLDLNFLDTFDYIFVTERNNIVDQMASLYKMLYKNTDYIDIDNDDVIQLFNTHKKELQQFYDIKKQLLQKNENVFVIDYEYLNNHSVNILNSITNMNFTAEHFRSLQDRKTNINYSKHFHNYINLVNLIDGWKFVK
jgi:hypothetical protein